MANAVLVRLTLYVGQAHKIDEEVKKSTKKLRGNRGSLRSHSGNLRNCMKFKEYIYNEPHLD
jgi:hypothetical protein